MVKFGETLLEGEGGTSKNPWDSLCMVSVYDGPMETVMLNKCG